MKAYEGNENYIFVSYAHADSKEVVPIIDVLQEAGYRVWYDLGIEAGTEWPAYIEDHLNKCARIIAFVSPSAVESVNCRNEINYALMIKKEMLVVYLEETELKYGLSLQLNAIQSLFKSRHTSTKSFYAELLGARILQCCKTISGSENFVLPDEPISMPQAEELADDLDILEAMESGNRIKIKESRSNKPAVIATVGTMASNDPTNHWPLGSYNQIIDVEQYKVIHFHCKFIRPIAQSGNKEIGIMIFDNEDSLVYESRIDFNFSKGSDRFSTRWIISDSDGLKQKPGDYTVIIWVDDSRIIEYSFRIISSSGLTPTTTSTSIPNTSQDQSPSSEIAKLKNQLMYPTILRRYILTFILLCIGLALANGNGADIAVASGYILLIGTVWAYITLWKLTNKHIINNKIGTAIVLTIGFIYYGIALFILSLWTLINKNKWKIRIAQLERGL